MLEYYCLVANVHYMDYAPYNENVTIAPILSTSAFKEETNRCRMRFKAHKVLREALASFN